MGSLLNLHLTCPHCSEQTEINVSPLLTPKPEEICEKCAQPIYRIYRNKWLIELPIGAFFSSFFLLFVFVAFVLLTQGASALWEAINDPQIKPYINIALIAFIGSIILAKIIAYASVEYVVSKPQKKRD